MFVSNFYNNIYNNVDIIQNNRYNCFLFKNIRESSLIIQLNTFQGDKNLKIIKLFFLLFFVTGQRPFMKKVKFNYVKKQILKKFFFIVILRNKKLVNFLFYFSHYYLFFFNIYYLNNLKYNVNNNNFIFYIDNIQSQFKNYGRLYIKSQIKLLVKQPIKNSVQFIKLLNNFQLLNLFSK